jgi:predicted RNase H-like HicB family nuclease
MEVVEDTEEGGFIVSFPDLRGCITYAATAAKAIEAASEAKRVWFEAALEDGFDFPEPSADDSYSGQFKFRLPKSLHRQLSEHAKREGISMNQYCLFLLTKYDTAYTRDRK